MVAALTDLVNPNPDDPITHPNRMDACQAAISEAMVEAAKTGEKQTILVCLDCPRDWTGHSCPACETITVLSCGKVCFEAYN